MSFIRDLAAGLNISQDVLNKKCKEINSEHKTAFEETDVEYVLVYFLEYLRELNKGITIDIFGYTRSIDLVVNDNTVSSLMMIILLKLY